MSQQNTISSVKNAIAFWTKISQENNWSMHKRGVTIWVDKNGNTIDSLYNPPNDNDLSYVVDSNTNKILQTINNSQLS